MENNYQRGSEFTMTNPNEYRYGIKAMGPDGFMHNTIYHKEKGCNAYIVKQRYAEDMSFYAPYLLNKIGKKVNINTPETELGFFIVKDDTDSSYRDAFFRASCVFLGGTSKMESFLDEVAYIEPEVSYAIYCNLNPEEARTHREKCNSTEPRALPMTIDEYIDSNIFILTTRGAKPQEEYTKSEINQMRQELVDRAVLGLKLGITGKTQIITRHFKNAALSPYYLATHKMFGLNKTEEAIQNSNIESDDEFKKEIEENYTSQFGVPPNIEEPTTEKALKYLFDNYPEETERAYTKVKSYTTKDLERELNLLTDMDEHHKKFALRCFDVKNQIFEQVYTDYLKRKTLEERL